MTVDGRKMVFAQIGLPSYSPPNHLPKLIFYSVTGLDGLCFETAGKKVGFLFPTKPQGENVYKIDMFVK